MRAIEFLATAAVATAAAAALPAGASAATNPYSAEQICGPGFVLAEQFPLRSNNGKVLLGEIKLMYGPGARPGDRYRSCGVVLKRRNVGKASYTSVSMAKKSRNPKWKSDGDPFSYYAGPVYVTGTPGCVRIGGFMNIPGGREGIFVEPSWYGGHCA